MDMISVVGDDSELTAQQEYIIEEAGHQKTPYITFDGYSQLSGQYFILGPNNSLFPVINNGLFLAEDDDDEVPIHIMDHMYARKPRAPGTEPIKPIKRRARKKGQPACQVFTNNFLPESPRINIIRQRLPIGSQRQSIYNLNLQNLSFHESMRRIELGRKQHLESKVRASREEYLLERSLKIKKENEARMLYDDCEVPQPGAIVTVGGSGLKDKRSKVKLIPKEPSPTNYVEIEMMPLEIPSSSQDEDPLCDMDVFPDFTIEESEELDVDFNELQMTGSGEMNNFISSDLQQTPRSDELRMKPRKEYHQYKLSPNEQGVNEEDESQLISNNDAFLPVAVNGENDSSSINQNGESLDVYNCKESCSIKNSFISRDSPSSLRRSSRSMKASVRLDDLGEITRKRKR